MLEENAAVLQWNEGYGMVTEQLLNYICRRRKAGAPDLTIMQDLIAAGWKLPDVEGAFDELRGTVLQGAVRPDVLRKSFIYSGIFGASVIICLIVIGMGSLRIMNVLNPVANMQAAAQDKIQADLVSMRTSLSLYYSKYEKFPDTLEDLVGGDVSLVRSRKMLSEFDYAPKNDNQDYRLCITSAAGDQSCTSREDDFTGFGPTPTPEE